MNELKACVCGGKVKCDTNMGMAFILCDKCGAVTSFRRDNGKSATIAAWNRRADDWISVEERLPVVGKTVIICIGGTSVTHAFRLLSGAWFSGNQIVDDKRGVTHWKPLPEPPKGE